MEETFDLIWDQIVAVFYAAGNFIDFLLQPFHFLGPAIIVMGLAGATVVLVKYLSKRFKTKRYHQLKKEFQYWYDLRQEALKAPENEKGKRLARNIDKAELNRVYYDYFFENLLNSMATKYLPILLVLAYVNDRFRPELLMEKFGRTYLFAIPGFSGGVIEVGAVFWFVFWIVGAYLIWHVIGKKNEKKRPVAVPST